MNLIATISAFLSASLGSNGPGPTAPIFDHINPDDAYLSEFVAVSLALPTYWLFPAAGWTQCETGELAELRALVSGTSTASCPSYDPVCNPPLNWRDYSYSVHIWNGFDSYVSHPGYGDIVVPFGNEPSNEGWDVPIGGTIVGLTFDWRFDLSEHNIVLDAGNDYLIAIVASADTFPNLYVRILISSVAGDSDYISWIDLKDGWDLCTDFDVDPKLALSLSMKALATPCAGDADGSGHVDIDDLHAVIDAWGNCECCAADLDRSGIADVDDLLAVINAWGPCEE